MIEFGLKEDGIFLAAPGWLLTVAAKLAGARVFSGIDGFVLVLVECHGGRVSAAPTLHGSQTVSTFGAAS